MKDPFKESINEILMNKASEAIKIAGFKAGRSIMVEQNEDPALDPELDREFFLKSIEEKDSMVTIKTLGVGKNKPVSVYIDGARWEMFPGPVRAEEEAIKFINSNQFEKWQESHTAKKSEEESSKDDEKDTGKEDVMDSIVSSKDSNLIEDITFEDGDTTTIKPRDAVKMYSLYESLDSENRLKFMSLINKSKSEFMSVLEFSLSNV
tara:strand:- start:1296 stop:1916 length:621 start_codon:yes stop_codon:yes gene_type:complete